MARYVDLAMAGQIAIRLAEALREFSIQAEAPKVGIDRRSVERYGRWLAARDAAMELVEVLGPDKGSLMPRPFVEGIRGDLELLWHDVHHHLMGRHRLSESFPPRNSLPTIDPSIIESTGRIGKKLTSEAQRLAKIQRTVKPLSNQGQGNGGRTRKWDDLVQLYDEMRSNNSTATHAEITKAYRTRYPRRSHLPQLTDRTLSEALAYRREQNGKSQKRGTENRRTKTRKV